MARKRSFGKVAVVAFASLVMAFAMLLPQFAFADGAAEEVVTEDLKSPTIYDATSAKAGKLTVTLNGFTDVDGYEYEVALNKSYTKGLKQKNSAKSTVTFSSLKPGKTYYIRVRDYVTIGDVKYYSLWSSDKAKVAIKHSSSKIVGKWKLVKSSVASENSTIKNNKKVAPKKKYTLTFKKNGIMIERDYLNKKVDTVKWAATAKNVGYFVASGIKVGSIKIKKGKLIVNNTEKVWTLVRV